MMLSTLLAAGLMVGIPEVCATNGLVTVDNCYAESVRKAGDIPVVICRAAKPADYDRMLAKLDVLLVTGGEDVEPARYGAEPSPKLGRVNLERDAFEFDLLRAAVRRELPLIGVCRGEQVLNVFFGGSLYQDIPSEIGTNVVHSRGNWVVNRAKYIHDITVEPGSRLAKVLGAGTQPVNSSHHQSVQRLAPGLTVVARTADGVVEAYEGGWYPVAGVQFHPECMSALMRDKRAEKLFRNLAKLVGKAPRMPRVRRPIGVFDSGIGGLSVLEQILKLDRFDNATGKEGADGRPDFAAEDFVYFGDQANMPYGRYDAAGKADFLRELVVRDAQFVLGSEGHSPSKIVVVACNTATAYGLEAVQAMPRPHDAKVIGVVNSGVEAALDELKGEAADYAIAVMATPGTIASGVYERTIRGELKRRAVGVSVEVANRGGIGLAEAVENNEPGMAECARTNVVALVEDYRARGGKAPIKAMILGCTHYPFVLDTIRATFDELRRKPEYAGLIAADLRFVDPAVNVAVACYRALRDDKLLRRSGKKEPTAKVSAFLSVGKKGPLPDAVKYGRNVGDHDIGTRIEPMTVGNMPKGAPELVRKMMPASAKALGF